MKFTMRCALSRKQMPSAHGREARATTCCGIYQPNLVHSILIMVETIEHHVCKAFDGVDFPTLAIDPMVGLHRGQKQKCRENPSSVKRRALSSNGWPQIPQLCMHSRYCNFE